MMVHLTIVNWQWLKILSNKLMNSSNNSSNKITKRIIYNEEINNLLQIIIEQIQHNNSGTKTFSTLR